MLNTKEMQESILSLETSKKQARVYYQKFNLSCDQISFPKDRLKT